MSPSLAAWLATAVEGTAAEAGPAATKMRGASTQLLELHSPGKRSAGVTALTVEDDVEEGVCGALNVPPAGAFTSLNVPHPAERL